MIPKKPRIKSKAIRQHARGQECTVRYYGICNSNPETVVLAHVNGGGVGLKGDDFHAAFACSSCHDEYDRRTRKIDNLDIVILQFLRGVLETQRILYDDGLIEVRK